MPAPLLSNHRFMSAPLKQVLFLILFFALIGVVFVLRDTLPAPAQDRLSREDALRRHGFYLEECSKKCGIDFVHEPPVLDPKLKHIMPIVASTGASVSVVDFDRDGFADLFVVNSAPGSKCRLYHNKRDGTFEDVAERL